MKSLAKLIGVGLVALALPFAASAGSAKAKNLNLEVTNLTTPAAETQVQNALNAIDGVEVKQVNAKAKSVHVMIDTEKTSAATVVSALKAAGFEAKVQAEQPEKAKS